MKHYLTLIAVLVIIVSSEVQAIDTFNKIARERPVEMNLSKTQSGHSMTVSYVIEGDKAPLNTIHSWTITVTDKKGDPVDGADIIISADMPEHLHGMTTRPVITAGTAPGQYEVEGMNFHMPGWWEIILDISKGRSRTLVRFNLIVGEELPMKEHDHMKKHNHMMNKRLQLKKTAWQGY